MSTTNSGSFGYCTPTQFVERVDVRTVGDWLSDNDIRLTPIQILNSQTLLDLLQEASGIVEAYVFKGQRYTATDLLQIACVDTHDSPVLPITNSAQMLYGIVTGICLFLVWQRRPAVYAKAAMPLRCEVAWEQLQALGDGAQIFGLLETAEAGVPQPNFMTPQQIVRRNFSSNQARAYFGDRAQFQVPGP